MYVLWEIRAEREKRRGYLILILNMSLRVSVILKGRVKEVCFEYLIINGKF